MRKRICGIFCFALVASFTVAPCTAIASPVIQHNYITQEIENETGVNLEIVAEDYDNNRSLARVSTHSANGEIIGNGVRLRKEPSLSATVLESMYDGELIWIDWSAYGSAGLDWHRIQRIKTGTYGWVYKSYVYYWD